ncbi:MAG: type 1 glutamine amidotransferase [Candidatus Hydrogenedentes bacterium]|nr:type 1 glutamine amidotransferase [Candidatus Hydrogenedentota bacterium]
MPKPLRVLIPDGYPMESREQFNQVGMRLAAVLYGDLLQKYVPGAEYDIWYSSDPGAQPPTDERLAEYHAVIWPGCNLTIYHDDDPRVQNHLRLCARVYEAGLPQFGSCWGIQLATTVAGGRTEAHPGGREMGIATKIQLTEAGRKHPMTEGKPEVYSHFVSHDDQVVELPECATRLAGNDWSRVQAVEVRYKNGIFWATQYHPEYNLHEMAALILAREDRLLKQGFFHDSADVRQYAERLETVFADPSRKDIRWQLKIDDSIVEDSIREREFANWLKYLVLPRVAS